MATTNVLPECQFAIINGPSKFDLMVSLFDGKSVKITCDLKTAANAVELSQTAHRLRTWQEIIVIFSKVGIEDGSRDSWLGVVTFVDKYKEREFYYNTRTRTGHIRETAK